MHDASGNLALKLFIDDNDVGIRRITTTTWNNPLNATDGVSYGTYANGTDVTSSNIAKYDYRVG